MNSHAYFKYMQFNTTYDDSDINKVSWLKDKLNRQWEQLYELEADNDSYGNQLLIDRLLARIDLLSNLLNHYIYN